MFLLMACANSAWSTMLYHVVLSLMWLHVSTHTSARSHFAVHVSCIVRAVEIRQPAKHAYQAIFSNIKIQCVLVVVDAKSVRIRRVTAVSVGLEPPSTWVVGRECVEMSHVLLAIVNIVQLWESVQFVKPTIILTILYACWAAVCYVAMVHQVTSQMTALIVRFEIM